MDAVGSRKRSAAYGRGGAWAAAAVALIALLSPASAGAAGVQARPAGAFIDSIGVATHTSYSDTVYASRFQELKARLVELGARHIREDLLPNRSDQYTRLNELAAAGIGSTLIMGKPTNGISGLETLVSVVKSRLNGVEALEGPNEYYLSGQQDWAAQVTDYQQDLYSAIKSDPALASLPVLGPSTIFWQKGELGDISQWLDYGTIHPYPGAYPVEGYLGRHMEFAKRSSAEKPLMATETGYHNAMNWTGGHEPVPEQATAVYMPRIFLEHFRRGVARTFAYELVDHFPNAGLDDAESHFGLLRNDLSPKPAFVALRNMIDIVDDPLGPDTAGSLAYSLGGAPEDLRQVLLQKGDGSFYLALWRTSSVWDPVNKVSLNPPSARLTIDLEQPLESAQLYAPNSSNAPTASFSGPTSLTLDVGAQVRIVRMVPSPGSEPSSEPGPEPTPEPAPEPTPEAAPEPTPDPTPAPEEETSPPNKKGKGGGPKKGKRVLLWTSRRLVRAGQPLTVRVRVIGPRSQRHTRVTVQRWRDGWRAVGRGRTSRSGFFGGRVSLGSPPPAGVTYLRVVAPVAAPSRPVHIRVVG